MCARLSNRQARSKGVERGMAYLGLLLSLALLSIAALATMQVHSFMQRRAAEEELIFIGQQFQQALSSYANATPSGALRAPPSLNDLLRDPRYPKPRRHLRQLYPDPMNLEGDWGLVLSPDGKGIVGIYSKSERTPIKIAQFPASLRGFEGKKSYQEWVFKAP
ncbi:MAG: type II secretion system protein [Undibacterium umbellatum]|uniref:type II secretion system protein n=1 Tax=Undibacterium umbellatum TaxID=2762300 RepID=UPI003BB5FA96